MKLKLSFLLAILLLTSLASAATLQGSVYNSNLELETDVLVEVGTQKFLTKDGNYQFELTLGTHEIIATKGLISTTEEVQITNTGTNVFDVFLLDDFTNEDDLWKDTEEEFFTEDEETGYALWRYVLGGLVILALLTRFFWMRKKFGSIRKFKRHHKAESRKTIEQHKKEIDKEPGYLDRTVEIIKKHDGRIHQKTLRKEMLDISESKVSLILTELEHKGKIERIKKGRGNVIILK
jgi:uncharacterized membrane protein